jgi:hypothetical protein
MDNVVLNITEQTDNVQINVVDGISKVFVNPLTMSGDGTFANPLSAVAGSGDMLRATYDPTNKNADAFSMENMVEGATKKILTSAERTKLNNLSGTNTGDQDLTPYLTSATAAATYQPIGAYLTTISGLNISQLTNDSGYITSAALSPYQPILVSGTNIKTVNGTSLLGAGDITISGAPALTSGSIPFSNGSTLIEDNTNLFWDNTNKRLGIGTKTPNQQLEITGNFRLPGTTSTAGIIYKGSTRFIHAYGTSNVFFGENTGNLTNTGLHNVGIGTDSLKNVTTGGYNIGLGRNTLSELTTGQGNTAIGNSALSGITSQSDNVCIGNAAFFLTNVSSSVGIGKTAGMGVTGSFSFLTLIGTLATVASGTITNATAIGAYATVGASNSMVLGGTGSYAVKVGIGISSPSARLHLPAGTATANTAPLKLTAGTNLTTPENGAFEFDGTNLYFTVGGVRKTVSLV